MDQRGSGGQKRARGDASQDEGDWTCPECGNVNFAFRNTCNLRKCGASKPSLNAQRMGPVNPPPLYEPVPAQLYMGGPGMTPSVSLGMSSNYGMSMGVPSAASLPYEYSGSSSYPSAYPSSYPSSYPASYPSSYGSVSLQSTYGPSMGGGYGYGSGPVMDGAYGMGISMGRAPMIAGPGTGVYMDENGSRKRRGDDTSEGDWVCPKCSNKNFAFRTVCNMRTCGTPKPSAPAPRMLGKSSSSGNTPDGSWTCEKCGNINYPFRSKCNRKSCGAEKPADTKQGAK